MFCKNCSFEAAAFFFFDLHNKDIFAIQIISLSKKKKKLTSHLKRSRKTFSLFVYLSDFSSKTKISNWKKKAKMRKDWEQKKITFACVNQGWASQNVRTTRIKTVRVFFKRIFRKNIEKDNSFQKMNIKHIYQKTRNIFYCQKKRFRCPKYIYKFIVLVKGIAVISTALAAAPPTTTPKCFAVFFLWTTFSL